MPFACPEFAEWVDWVTHERAPILASKTIKEYLYRLRAAELAFLNRGGPLREASPQQLERYLFSQKPTARTRNQVRCALIAYFDWVITRGHRDDNPARSLPRLPENRPVPIPIDSPGRLLTAAWLYSPAFGALVTLYLYTGLRLSETLNLRWEHIHGTWAYLRQKGNQHRAVFLNTQVLRALEQLPHGSPWLFPSPIADGPLSANWVWRKIRDLGMKAGIPGCRPHRLRYTFADSVVEISGGDAFAVRDALGHRSLQSAMHYVAARPQRVRAILEQMDFRQ